jgi:NitT/TauT family transport system ATP-binding protein
MGTTAAAPAVVRLRGAGKTYANGTVALVGLDLAVGDGEFLSLLGPSGCGKSTVLRLIAGLAGLSRGVLEWAQEDAGEGARVGFVFQEPTLMPWATAAANVRMPLTLLGVRGAEADARVEEALGLVGLDGFERAYPRELSGGMKMRVSIARALATRPRVLLMDEPFASLDEITRVKLNNDLLALWRLQGWTVVFVTHSVYESVYLSNRIAVMTARPGRVIAEVPVDTPYPRDEAFRTSAEYNTYCRAVSARLAEAMTAGGAPAR